MKNNVIILAAGKGSRMKSNLPKVLQPLSGKSLLEHVLTTAKLFSNEIIVVIGHGAEVVEKKFAEVSGIKWVVQEQQLGTGHAVKQALPILDDNTTSLILYGDVPLIKNQTLQKLLDISNDNTVGLLTIKLPDPKGYGRIIRDVHNKITSVVEEKDANTEQKNIKEVNTGIIAVRTNILKNIIPMIKNKNAQGEYYLTDIIGLCVNQGIKIEAVITNDEVEVQGVNDKKQLSSLERAYQKRAVDDLMDKGATVIDPSRLDIRGEMIIGQDVIIDINCVFIGKVILGNNVVIGPNCVIGSDGKTVIIGNNVEIKANSVIEAAEISNDCSIGPFARLRPGTVLSSHAKIGNFVETKNAQIGEDSKVSHLTYIGDAIIGKNVNIGAGTITCNYDGVNKFKTIIEDGVFVGSNTSLVAPLTIGEGATVGAGSTINKNINKNDLAVARAEQKNIQGWVRPKKK